MSTVTETKAETKPFRLFTPMRTYLFVSALLVFLVTSPFTVGRGIARFCDFVAATWSGVSDAISTTYAVR